jgi:hypothetical protein
MDTYTSRMAAAFACLTAELYDTARAITPPGALDLGRLNRYQNYPRYLALPYVLRFCQAVDVAGNTLFSGMVALSSTSEHTPCNNA